MQDQAPITVQTPETAIRAAHFLQPYTLVYPAQPLAPVLFTSPHSGRDYPDSMLEALAVPLLDLQRTEDAFVDELFSGVHRFGATLMTARYARTVTDLNRDSRELDPAMFENGHTPRKQGTPTARVNAGLGCLPRVSASGEAVYSRLLTTEEGEARLSQIHDAWHETLSAELQALRARFGACILIDCHSMPSRQPGRRPLPDIVLGDRFGSSCSYRLTGLVERAFRTAGLTVARNAPYAGGYTTLRHGRPRRGRHSLQIEINRSLYMDEARVEKTNTFSELSTILMDVAEAITQFSRTL